MPKYFCDYCDTYLTHDSPSVRKTHCAGRKHRENVRFYYEKWYEDNIQRIQQQQQKSYQQQLPHQHLGHSIPPPGSFSRLDFPPPMTGGLPTMPPPPMTANVLIPPPNMLNPHQMPLPPSIPPPNVLLASTGSGLLPPPPSMADMSVPPPNMATSSLPPPQTSSTITIKRE